MYKERKTNIAVFRGCNFNCCYCAFRKSLWRLSCLDCKGFKPHSHIEVLRKTSPSTKKGEFVTIGLTGDISFMDGGEFYQVLEYCHNHPFTTFLIQSKNPEYFLTWQYVIPRNVILGTTIETDLLITTNMGVGMYEHDSSYQIRIISNAPSFRNRYNAMLKLNCRKAVTIEPIMFFLNLGEIIKNIHPEFLWIGYDSKPEKNHLPEPTFDMTLKLIKDLIDSGIPVHQKLIRKAWYEK